MDSGTFTLSWDENGRGVTSSPAVVPAEDVTCALPDQSNAYQIIPSDTIADTDQIAAENLMYLAQDMVAQMAGYVDTSGYAAEGSYEAEGGYEADGGYEVAGGYEVGDGYEASGAEVECVTEEVITDDWVQPGGQERVEVPLDHPLNSEDTKLVNDDVMTLPTIQDQYTAMRPWPCDFCSRRFRKKSTLTSHMVAHQNDRPHACNLCGLRYTLKSELMDHLKTHALVPEDEDQYDYEPVQHNTVVVPPRPKKKKNKRKRPRHHEEENGDWENMTSARTQMWQRRPPRVPSPPRLPERSPTPPSPVTPAIPASPPSPPTPPPPADPRRPFVCTHCGVAFAREKALQSHARIHGGESPVECGECRELCWSREGLVSHTRSRHPHLAPSVAAPSPTPLDDDSSSYDDEDYLMPEIERTPMMPKTFNERMLEASGVGPELFCQDCGVAFQRADLLRRHVTAAHRYKRHDSETVASDVSGTEHTCDVCGETCQDALQLLAHAEGHTGDNVSSSHRSRRARPGVIMGKTYPCSECGKVFGSRSSQQIHVRIHTGERPYGCRFCWKAFADGGTLRKHERIHTGEKPYACAVCPRAFNQRVVLREHVRSHHSAPDHRRGQSEYHCAVCSRSLQSSSELVQHLIEHCDTNTALKRQPQTGPRKYKRRQRIMREPAESWEESLPPSPQPSPPRRHSPPPRPRPRKRPRKPAPPRPKMIHTYESTVRPRTKNVSATTTAVRVAPATFPHPMSAEPADDLQAILPQLKRELESSITSAVKMESVERTSDEDREDGLYHCEMCSQSFCSRSDLLLHVPVHI